MNNDIPVKPVTNEDGITGYTTDTRATRTFESGATRSSAEGRYDPEGYLSPLSVERYCEYMRKHQYGADGAVRQADNWQKGMPLDTFMKGMWRHMLHLWLRHRGFSPNDAKAAADTEEDLCAILFNVQGYMHELIKARLYRKE